MSHPKPVGQLSNRRLFYIPDRLILMNFDALVDTTILLRFGNVFGCTKPKPKILMELNIQNEGP